MGDLGLCRGGGLRGEKWWPLSSAHGQDWGGQSPGAQLSPCPPRSAPFSVKVLSSDGWPGAGCAPARSCSGEGQIWAATQRPLSQGLALMWTGWRS